MDKQRLIEQRILAQHRIIAERLRSSSPNACVIGSRERWAILREIPDDP